jgi:glutathione S-transferase
MIDLYTAPTPNGHKASCTLEALEIPYETQFVNISEGEQHQPEFRAINPNGRIPAIADIANWCWVRTYKWSGVSIEGLEHLQRWLQVMREQPGMTAGIEVPFSLGNLLENEKEAQDFANNAKKTLQT